MRVTVIAQDKLIAVDGVAITPVEMEYDEALHAIQWDEQTGHIEWKMQDGGIQTAPVTEFEITPYVEAWQAEKKRLEAEANMPLSLEEAKAAKQAELSAAYEYFLAALQPEYTTYERDTWATQVEEAKALLADPQAEAAFIRSACTARGDVTPVEFAGRVMENRTAWVVLSGFVTGPRHNFQKKLDEALSVEEVQGVEVIFTVPDKEVIS